MDSHIQGPVSSSPTSVGAIKSHRGFALLVAGGSYNNGLLCTIEASADNPILVKFDGYVETVFNGGAINTLSIGTLTNPTAYMATGVINPATLGFQVGKATLLRARTAIYATLQTGTSATGTFTPPTSSTATCVINGVSFLATFASNATTTVTNLKALIAANPTITALVTTSGTTTLVLTAKQTGTSGNAITTTSNAANGASFAAATLTGGANDATTGLMEVLVDATGLGKGAGIAD